jgi:hypothetical protein
MLFDDFFPVRKPPITANKNRIDAIPWTDGGYAS